MRHKSMFMVALSLFLALAIILCGLPPAVPSPVALADKANGDFLSGDVTGDGVVDGKEALKIARIVEGLTQPSGSGLQAGDVYPFPGIGRRLGDGQLTDKDALRILRHTVGLVSSESLQGTAVSITVLVSLIRPPANT